MKQPSIVEQLAEFSAALNWDTLPTTVQDKLKSCTADALECCLAGANADPRTLAVWQYVKSGTGCCAVFGRGKQLSAENAAFYNAVTGAVSSRNDTSKAGSCHAGSVVVPTVLALAQETGCSGKAALEAILAGYETMIRLGIALKKAKHSPAFRSTALLAPFGAAFAAAHVLGLNAAQTASAASFACHSMSGFNNWVVEGTGEDVLQNAWGARNGIAAAHLAATGLPGSKFVLEDENGVLAAFGALDFAEDISAGLGEKWHILDVDYKAMGSCLKLMAPCQAAKKLLAELPAGETVESVRIGVAASTLRAAGTADTAVDGQVQAIMSIPFGVANVLATGDYSHIDWYPPYTAEVCGWMKKVTVAEEPKLTAVFPGKRGADITVTLTSGKTLYRMQEDVESLSVSAVWELFAATMTRVYGADAAAALTEQLHTLEQQPDLAALFGLLAQANKGALPEA